MQYMKQLDSLRAFAVLGVLFHHYVAWMLKPVPPFKSYISTGGMGVDLFFVLSGFLISSILMKYKVELDGGDKKISHYLAKFYIRRTLRIFPIYYLTLIVALLLSIDNVRGYIMWHFFYATNFIIAHKDSWILPVGHFWSLAVEEQFYLLWPLVILLVPRKRLFPAIVLTMMVSPVFRIVCGIVHAKTQYGSIMVLGNMDLFASGAVLAYIRVYGDLQSQQTQTYFNICLIAGGFFCIGSLLLDSLGIGIGNSVGVFLRTFEGFFFSAIIFRASRGFKGIAGKCLEAKPLVYIGKISYGIYLYHLFVPLVLSWFATRLGVSLPGSMFGIFFVNTAGTILLASLSWHVIEKPISIFKDKMKASSNTKEEPVGLLLVE